VRRVGVTGLGAISSLGGTLEENWRAVISGRSGIASHVMDPGERGPPAQELPLARVAPGYGGRLDQALGRPIAASLDPFATFLLLPALEALEHAGLRDDPVLREDTAIVVGHGLCGITTLEASYERFFGQRSPRLHPATVPKVMVSAGASALAMTLNIHGPVFATSSACASSGHAIAQGAALIASGEAEVALVGGSEAVSTCGSLRAWEAIHALSSTACRPFSADRDGMILGEGGAILVLEEVDRARARGAPLLGELVGVGMSSDAFDITKPAADGQARALAKAARAARALERTDILVSAHGTGTPLNDSTEAQALLSVFGSAARQFPVIATKSAHGHLIGGSAALQAALGLRALAEGLAPPIQNFTTRDPDCDLDLVIGQARPIASALLLQNAFAFGGLNVALAFSAAP
jgi:nodulation protein E